MNQFLSQINRKQKILLAFITPVILFFLTLPIINSVHPRLEVYFLGFNDFHFMISEAWWVWFGFFSITGYLEFKLLGKLD